MFAVEGTTVYGEAGRRIYQVNNGMTMWEQVIPKIHPFNGAVLFNMYIDVDGNTLYVGTRTRGCVTLFT